jgi:hypothetical protein
VPWTEVEVAEAIEAYFHERHFETYPEVDMGGPRADIVAVFGPMLIWVETKTSLRLSLLGQALRATRLGANQVYVAVPKGKCSEARNYALESARHMGIGVLEVQRQNWSKEIPYSVKLVSRPRWIRNKRMHPKLRDACVPETRRVKAGSASGGHWTAFRGTMKAALDLVKETPGMTTKQLLSKLEHHYASDRSAAGCFHQYAQSGLIGKYGLRMEKHGRQYHWYAKESADA